MFEITFHLFYNPILIIGGKKTTVHSFQLVLLLIHKINSKEMISIFLKIFKVLIPGLKSGWDYSSKPRQV